ncbi:MAG TPA: gamma-glutamyltransferase [Usitatibacter sp.]|nr:gamma-glutamyltransferase [Usitatibacter sp.]
MSAALRAAARACGWLLAALAGLPPAHGASFPPAMAENGMVVSAHALATKIGVEVLERGGNAVDAAVAVGYALAVVYPAAGNLGGGGFMTLHMADGRSRFIDFRERAPLAARPNMYLDAAGNVIRGASTRGHLAVAVPGTVAGLELARVKYGTMKRAPLIAPAMRLAEKGFVLARGDVDMLRVATEDFRRDPASAAIFLDEGRPLEPGARLVQRDLARTLLRIAKQGPEGFYAGPTAAAIVASSRAGKGLITHADLEQYAARERAPVECDYRGFHIVTAAPPSAGGAIVCQILNVLEGYPLKELGHHSAQAVHYQVEAMRHGFLDRNTQVGDPDFVANPVARLVDKEYAARIRAAIDPARAGASTEVHAGTVPREGSNTTHYSIVDRHGNAVAVTYTLNDWFGARVTAAGTGVLLNNEMDDFTVKEGVANHFGLVQGERNAIAGGKRPLSSMSPTIVLRDGKPVMVLGTPGGSRIISIVVQLIVNVIDHGMTVQEAVDAPRLHHQWLPDLTYVEARSLSPDTRRLLEAMGHKLGPPPPPGHAAAILVGAPALQGRPVGSNRLYGAIDPRRPTGLAAGH